MQRNIKKKKVKENVVEIEVINLPTDSVNLETVLPMIDHTDICSFVISEVRRQIVKKNVSTFISIKSVKATAEYIRLKAVHKLVGKKGL